jgi:hypothetical protein
MLVFLSAVELHQYVQNLLRGADGEDISAVDWQASFLEVVPAETSLSGISAAVSAECPAFENDQDTASDLRM